MRVREVRLDKTVAVGLAALLLTTPLAVQTAAQAAPPEAVGGGNAGPVEPAPAPQPGGRTAPADVPAPAPEPPPPTDGVQEDAVAAATFLKARAGHSPWLDHGQPSATARAVIGVLNRAGDDGLTPADYSAAHLAALADHLAEHPDGGEAGRAFEQSLTVALLRYARDLSTGRIIPRLADPELAIDKPESDRAQILAGVAGAADPAAFLASLAPAHPQYAALKAALAHMRDVKAAGGWPSVPAGPTLKPGMKDDRVPALRARLAATGELSPSAVNAAEPDLYDAAVEAAVHTFQRTHGQEPDGTVGGRTLIEMNMPVGQRITQILVNMERWRWVRHPAGLPFVSVNLADYSLAVMRGTETLQSMRVVVGAPFARSPVFSGQMRYIDLNPYWYVPPKIAKEEILPKLKKNPNYLTKGHYTLLSDWSDQAVPVDPATINWAQVTPRGFHWRVRQEPGNENSLGRIKFMFPNKYDVYLHDTPSKRLFDRALRSFSHGCIRVQDPPALALTVLALTNTPGWPEDKLRAAIGGDDLKHQTVRLKTPLAVEITYLTTLVDHDGTLNFRTDIYGRDARIAAAITASHLPDPHPVSGTTGESGGGGGGHPRHG